MRKFSQPVAMPCTEQQYKADLEKPLKEMGVTFCRFQESKGYTIVAHTENGARRVSEAYRLKEYNPLIFLAIAGICDNEIEILPYRYFRKLKGEDKGHITNLFRAVPATKELKRNGLTASKEFWAPATLEEIVSAFGKRLYIDLETYSEIPISKTTEEKFKKYNEQAIEAQELWAGRVQNPVPGRTYLCSFIHDEFTECVYVGKTDKFVVEIAGQVQKVEALYEKKVFYTEEDMRFAWDAGRLYSSGSIIAPKYASFDSFISKYRSGNV